MSRKIDLVFFRMEAVAVLCGFVSLAASAQQVTYNFMPGTDFTKYHTYKWVEIASNIHPNQIVDQEIRQAVNNARSTRNASGTPGAWAADFVEQRPRR